MLPPTEKTISFSGQFEVTVVCRSVKEGGRAVYLLLDSNDLDIRFEIAKSINYCGHHPTICFDEADASKLHAAAMRLQCTGMCVKFLISSFDLIRCVGKKRKGALYKGELLGKKFQVVEERTKMKESELVDIDTSFDRRFDSEPGMSLVPESWLE